MQRKREIFEAYRQLLGNLPGISLMPEAPRGRATRGQGHLIGWLTCITVDPEAFGLGGRMPMMVIYRPKA